MLFWKEVIRPGTYWYVDETTGKPARLDATTEAIKYWCDQGNAMRAAGLSIPVPLEHQKELKPLTPGERSARALLNNGGFVEKYDIRHGDRLYSLVDVDDEGIANKLPKTIKYTSPYISSFTDGNGKAWSGVITHLALTSRPRIHQQEPFGNAEAALSIAVATPAFSPVKAQKGIFLSRAGLLDRTPAGLAPHYPMAFSVWSGATLAMDDMDALGKEPPKPKPGEKPGESPPPKPEGDKASMTDPVAHVEDDEMDLVEVLCDLVSAIWGMDLPEMTTEDNLAQNLLKALTDYLRTKDLPGKSGNDEMNDMNTPAATPEKPAPSPVVQESPPMFMSLEQIRVIADPTTRKMAEQLHVQQQKVAHYEARTLAAAKAARDQKIGRLANRLPQAARTKLLDRAQLPACALSMGGDGTVIDPLADLLDFAELSLRDLPALLQADGAALSVDPHPADNLGGPMSEERRKNVAKELIEAGGREYK